MCELNSLLREIDFRKLTKYLGHIFCIKRRIITGGSWKEPGKIEKQETEIDILNKTEMLNDKSMISKIG